MSYFHATSPNLLSLIHTHTHTRVYIHIQYIFVVLLKFESIFQFSQNFSQKMQLKSVDFLSLITSVSPNMQLDFLIDWICLSLEAFFIRFDRNFFVPQNQHFSLTNLKLYPSMIDVNI